MPASPLFDLTGRLALVTGSSGGIGYAIAAGLADAGAHVILNGRDATKLEEAAARLRDTPPQGATRTILTRVFDVTDRQAVEDAVGAIEAEDGPIRILVNNAGIQRRAPLDAFPPEDWSEIIRTNLDSVFFVGTAVARHMIPRGMGKIINIGSVQCELARPGIAPYTATKGAVKNLTRGMCAACARHGMQITANGPGYIETPLNRALVEDPEFNAWLTKRTPAGRWGKVEELQGAAIFLASDASSFVNGQTLYVDGGVLSVL